MNLSSFVNQYISLVDISEEYNSLNFTHFIFHL